MREKVWKPQVQIPPQLNYADMNERGERSGPLHIYGGPYNQNSVEEACKAWEVQAKYLINGNHAGKPPEISNASGPEYMLLFKDGLWRHATFRGLNGPPWFRVDFDGYPGVTGEVAYLHYQIHHKKRAHADAKHRLAAIEGELVLLCDRAEALTQEAHAKPKE